MKTFHTIVILICCHAFNSWAAKSTLLINQWQKGIDTAVIQPLGDPLQNAQFFFIQKTYLNRGWKTKYPIKSQQEQYDIVEAKSGKTIPFLSKVTTYKTKIGKTSWNGNDFIIPVSGADNIIEIYRFNPKQGTVKRIVNTKKQNHLVLAVYAIPNGYITTYSGRSYVYAKLTSFTNDSASNLPIIPKQGEARDIYDLTVRGQQVYIVSRGSNSENKSSFWLYSFNHENPTKMTYSRIETSGKTGFRVKFIPSTSATPLFWLATKQYFSGASSVKIVSANNVNKTIWTETIDISQWNEHSLFEQCDGNILLAKITNNSGKPKTVNFGRFNNQGKKLPTNVSDEIFNAGGIITSFDFYPSDQGVYTNMTYRHGGDQGRVYWKGFRIKKTPINTACDNN